MSNRHPTSRHRHPPNPAHPHFLPNGRPADDRWVDLVADRVSEVLTEERLTLELLVFYDPVAEVLHAVGYDGAPARYFQCTSGGHPASVPRAGPARPPVSSAVSGKVP